MGKEQIKQLAAECYCNVKYRETQDNSYLMYEPMMVMMYIKPNLCTILSRTEFEPIMKTKQININVKNKDDDYEWIGGIV